MPRLLIIAQDSEALTGLHDSLVENGFSCLLAPYDAKVTELVAAETPDLVLVEMDENPSESGPWGLIQSIKKDSSLPVIALIARKTLADIDAYLHADDFLTSPFDTTELMLRINQILNRAHTVDSSEVIRSGPMVIDLASCDVTIYGRRVELTFKEYELLKFLAGNKGRVFSREKLLNRVWGYDYFGGDRTVDTHIRRLRSKTEDPNNSFIETVRNIGYRFKQDK